MYSLLYFISIAFSYFTVKRAKVIYGTYYNHYTMFDLWWLITITFSFYNEMLFKPAEATYNVFYIGLIFFNLTVFTLKKQTKIIERKFQNYTFPTLYRLILCGIVFFSLLSYAISNLYFLLVSDNFNDIHNQYFDDVASIGALMHLTIFPLVNVVIITTFYKRYDILNKKFFYFNVFLCLIIVIERCIYSGGGRKELMDFLFLYVICALVRNRNFFKNSLSENIRFNAVIMGPIIAIIAIFTIMRNIVDAWGGGSFIVSITNSYSLYVGIFDYYFSQRPNIAFSDFTWGLSLSESYIEFMNFFTRHLLGLDLMPTNYVSAGELTQTFIPLKTTTNNAHVTMYFRLFRDFGYVGITLGTSLFAYLFHWVYVKTRYDGFYFLIYIFMCYLIMTTTRKFDYAEMAFLVTILYMILIHKFILRKNGTNQYNNRNTYISG